VEQSAPVYTQLHECGVHAQSPGYMQNAAQLLYHSDTKANINTRL